MSPSLCRIVLPLACLVAAGCDSGGGTTEPGPGPFDPRPDADGTGSVSPSEDQAAPSPGLETLPTDEIDVPAISGADVVPSGGAPLEVPPGATLRTEATTLCPVVGEAFELSADVVPAARADGTAPAPFDATASVTLTQSYGEDLELLARGDESISLRMTRPDIVALRADFADDIVAAGDTDEADLSTGRTLYVGGFAADAPATVLMRKPVSTGCLYALRVADAGFCGTALSRGGSAALGTGDAVVTIDGCDSVVPDGLPVIELADDTAD